MSGIQLSHIDKIYENKVQAVFDFTLDIKDKEFIVFVGPSGCGKSTTLRMIAGLEEISKGDLFIDKKRINDVEPKDRDIAMVFQSYALYPHMSVYENMSFGLRIQKIPKNEIKERVERAAKILQLEDYLNAKPKELSGGQRQRVALGRAIVRNAKVFLMDEPLSNLDAKLRSSTRAQIIKLHKDLGATTIYVTHDQVEAMTMADRIVVMRSGRIEQVGSPKELYNNPCNAFVAGFIGSPAANFLLLRVKGSCLELDGLKLELSHEQSELLKGREEVLLGIRPEFLELKAGENKQKISASIDLVELLGHEYIVHASAGEQRFIAKITSEEDLKEAKHMDLFLDMSKVYFFDTKTQKRIN